LILSGDDRATALSRWIGARRRSEVLLTAGAVASDMYHDYGLRFIDLDGDGNDDVIFSNEREYGVYLQGYLRGLVRKVIAGKAGRAGRAAHDRQQGREHGFWVHSGHFWWSNEGTPLLKDHVARVSIKELLITWTRPPRRGERGSGQGGQRPHANPVVGHNGECPAQSVRSGGLQSSGVVGVRSGRTSDKMIPQDAGCCERNASSPKSLSCVITNRCSTWARCRMAKSRSPRIDSLTESTSCSSRRNS